MTHLEVFRQILVLKLTGDVVQCDRMPCFQGRKKSKTIGEQIESDMNANNFGQAETLIRLQFLLRLLFVVFRASETQSGRDWAMVVFV